MNVNEVVHIKKCDAADFVTGDWFNTFQKGKLKPNASYLRSHADFNEKKTKWPNVKIQQIE